MKRKLTSEFKIDGTPMLTPDAGVEIEHADLLSSDSGRDESGYLHNFVLRKDLRVWKFTYAFLTSEEYAYVRSLIRGKVNFTFTFKNEQGTTETIAAHCERSSAAWWSARRGLYRDMQFEIVEN